MKKSLMFLSLAAIGLASCNGGFKKGNGGLLYNIYTNNNGAKIKEGDFVSVNLVAKTDADSVLFSTYESEHPVVVQAVPAAHPGDVFEGLQMLTQGDSATIKISADSTFKKGAKPPGFKGNYIAYTIKVIKVIPKSAPDFQKQVDDYLKGQAVAAQNAEPIRIKKYIADNKLNVTKTDSGLYYSITKQGSGPAPVKGDTVSIKYVGKLINGNVFDTNIKEEAKKANKFVPSNPYQPIRFPIGVGRVIPGWDQGLRLLNKGAKATFIIPSTLAYRDRGNGPIAPYTSLIFEVEVVDIIHANPNAPKPVIPGMPQAQAPQQIKR
jgi:FKBP-type peptidyl-prolyl cis-trans isomerase FkpA